MTQAHSTSSPVLIDARGLNCPLPVLKLRKTLRGLPPGAVVDLFATDRAALRDVPAFCTAHGHAFEVSEAGNYLSFRIITKP